MQANIISRHLHFSTHGRSGNNTLGPLQSRRTVWFSTMNNANHYTKGNGMQKRDAFDVLTEYIDALSWSPGDVILDIGCGAGDVTANILLPKLPHDIGHLVGGDLSNDMVKHASDSFSHPKLTFTQLDIATQRLDVIKLNSIVDSDEDADNSLYDGVFDKLFSFYCLHWVIEQKQATKNMYNLIKPNGEGLVIFLANCPVFELYENISKKTQWQPYMKDVAQFVSPYQHSLDPRKEFEDLLQDAGFDVINCRVEKRKFPFGTVNLLKKALRAVNPFVDRLPHDLQEEYMNDYVSETFNLNLVDIVDSNNNNIRNGNETITVKYEIIIAHFKKL